MEYTVFLGELRMNLFHALDEKTGWGKEKIKQEYDRIVGMTLAEYLDRAQKRGGSVNAPDVERPGI